MARDGQHDFDFNLGTWKTHIKRLQHPLTGSSTWIELNGTVTVRKVWGGRAQLEEIEADGPTGHFEGLTVFLYNPQSREWSQYFASSSGGTLDRPAVGKFTDGRGELFGEDTYNGRSVLVRIVWSDITPESHHFEQSFSDDGGKTWEPNFVANLTLQAAGPASTPIARSTQESSSTATSAQPTAGGGEGQHDFDWELGSWKNHVERLQHPLTDSKTWIQLDGTVEAKKVWDGRANLAEIDVDGPTGHLEFLSLRLYNPEAHQWSLNFASSNVGVFSQPMIGEFKDGRGEFYDQETFNSKTILARFVFMAVTPNSGRSEQAFSEDGGKTWETNWINTYTRAK